ncbi:hypothetical protein CN961_12770 [Bacillus thuringiensis]|uniref:hypothetical protein n=1 Tax=Bacillus cereus group TaxID=86661 RepID=UPI000BF5C84A|nr:MULTISPECIES: hypothetical protein [Bacillus cereus group]PGC99057.1 hypothetical protein COM31_26540 [Bacillus toyonensis]PGN58826.1 hypothetical protein CN961_12770 [Bacillus thuringiensis]
MINDSILDAAQGKTGIQLDRANRPLVIADIKEYRKHTFLVVHVYDRGKTVGQIIAPMQEITSLAGKITEIVEASCDRKTPVAYDLHTCNDDIYKETLSSAYVLAEMKPKSACNECAVIMDDLRTLEALDDIYINEVEVQDEQEIKKRSAREKLKRVFKTMRSKMAGFIHRLSLSAK